MASEDCFGCNKPLSGRTLTAIDHKWHVDCWKCDDCGKPFFNGTSLDTFYHKGDRAVCDSCAEKGSPCGRCGESISYKVPSGSVVMAVGSRFHNKCFLCSVCSKPITNLRVSKTNIFCDTCPIPEEKEASEPASEPTPPEPTPPEPTPPEPTPEPTPEVSPPTDPPAPTEPPTSTDTPQTEAPASTESEPKAEEKESKPKPVCRGCNQEVSGRILTAVGGEWHPDCFKCAECGTPFPTGASFFTNDGKTTCTSCNEKAAPLCAGCGNKVIGRVITALDRKWHKECFVCTNCKGGFEGGKFVVRGWNPICHECAKAPVEKDA